MQGRERSYTSRYKLEAMKYKCYKEIQQNEDNVNSYKAIIYNEEVSADLPGCISYFFDYHETPNLNDVLLKEYFHEWPSSGALDLLNGDNVIGNTLEIVKEEDFLTIPVVLRNEISRILNN